MIIIVTNDQLLHVCVTFYKIVLVDKLIGYLHVWMNYTFISFFSKQQYQSHIYFSIVSFDIMFTVHCIFPLGGGDLTLYHHSTFTTFGKTFILFCVLYVLYLSGWKEKD